MSLAPYICLQSIMKTLPLILLVLFPMRDRMRFRYTTVLAISGAIYFFHILSSLYTFNPGFLSGAIRLGASLLVLMQILAIHLILLRSSLFQILFTLLIAKSYVDDLSLVAEILKMSLGNPLTSGKALLLHTILYALLLLLTMPLMLLFMEKCVRPILISGSDLPFWRYLWFLPMAFYFIYRMCIFPGYLDSDILHPGGSLLLALFWIIATFLTYYITLRMLMETARNAQLEEKLHIMDLQVSMQRENYEALQESIENTRRLRHDIRHHLAALRGYVEKEDCVGAGRYLDSVIGFFQIEKTLCANYALNAIARHYINIAQKSGCKVETFLTLPQTLSIPESDICVIFGNLLENAVEACCCQEIGERFIHVRAGTAGRNAIAMTIRNSHSNPIIPFGDSFRSSKRDSTGIGITSVRAISTRYSGILKFEYTENTFYASVLLNPPSLSK